MQRKYIDDNNHGLEASNHAGYSAESRDLLSVDALASPAIGLTWADRDTHSSDGGPDFRKPTGGEGV